MDPKTPIEKITRLTPRQKAALKKLGIATADHLLNHFPYRYEEPGSLKQIGDIITGDYVRVWGTVTSIGYEKTWKKKMNIASATVTDRTGTIQAVWFRQPYVAKILREGTSAIFSGKISIRNKKYYLANPQYEIVPTNFAPQLSQSASLTPLYPTSAGISSLWMQHAIAKILSQAKIEDCIPPDMVAKYRLPEKDAALRMIHAPKNPAHMEAAKKRLAFEEVFLLQLSRLKDKEEMKGTPGAALRDVDEHAAEFRRLLPFELTNAQEKALSDILGDLKSGSPMNRLLEGDVGSGKTAVAACAAYVVAKNRMQAAYMAPTELLARQHFEGFWKALAGTGIKIGLLTSSISEKFPSKIARIPTHVSKAQLQKWAREGEIHILIGTHSIIEKKVSFHKLALAMVDEQHRFGVSQRSRLLKKNLVPPHFLTMSATPIPRTLALSIYADLDLSLIDELPPGRRSIETKIVPPKDRALAYEFIRQKLAQGEQAFVICPRIEEKNDQDIFAVEMKSAKAEYKKLAEKIFPEYTIGLLHGNLPPKEKEEVMNRFRAGTTNILVSTSVVEVGVDVPNATIMMIEGGERFGLAQLHQFRGRVGRGEKKSYCFIFPTTVSQVSNERLRALLKAKNGFELAEYDLAFRGPGELGGKNQSGVSDIGMEALKNIKLVEAARAEAKHIIETNALARYPLLAEKIKELRSEPLHFE